MSDPLSFYMLVKNGERYLANILQRIAPIADEIIILDSGSTDRTEAIAKQWPVQWHFRAFDDFKNQRAYALSLCRFDHVLCLDADEIPDEEFIEHIRQLKQTGFSAQAYTLRREWIALGKAVHSIYPIESPDFPVRLINKKLVSLNGSTKVHESYSGYQSLEILNGKVSHLTFHSSAELQHKLKLYSAIAAQDLADKAKKFAIHKIIFNPLGAWAKWFFVKSGWRDGLVGITLANYALKYTFWKYWYLRLL
jgi:glycosyltransferase involved in cell wall biosynthesis